MIKKSNEYRTGNYALTTALVTLGFPWEDPNQPCVNAYRAPDRPERDARGRLKKLGKVTFMLGRTSSESDTPIGNAIIAYDGETAEGEPVTPQADLDGLIDGITDTGTRDAIRTLLPLAYAECARNTLANLKTVKDAPHNCAAHILVTKPGGGFTIIPEDASDELLERWNLKRKEATA